VNGVPGVRIRYSDGTVGPCTALDPSAGFSQFPENPLAAIGKFLAVLLKAETWVRVGLFIGGILLVLMGLQQLAKVLGVKLPSIPGVPGL